MKICDYGCNQDATFQLKNGKWCCSSSVNSCPKMKKKNSESIKELYMLGIKISGFKNSNRHNKTGWKPSTEAKEKWKRAAANGTGRIGKGLSSTIEKENERKQKISESIKKRYENGWMPKAGRCKKIKYISKIAGEVYLDGTWELKVAEYFDNEKISWVRNTRRFKYVYNNKTRNYTPDFYIITDNKYVEVKGYKTNLDEAKWEQFTEKLEIWDKKKLKMLNIL